MGHQGCALVRPLLLSIFLFCVSQAIAQQASTSDERPSNVILGVLEDHPGVYVGEPNFWRVRVLFGKKGSEWKAFPSPDSCTDLPCLEALTKSYPREVNWTIAFDGRKLGQVTTRTLPKVRSPDDVCTQLITSSGAIPTVGRRSMANSGFYFHPAYRSLVAVSKPYFRDPDVWKPTRLSAERVSALRQQFRSRFPKVANCKDADENVLKPWPYRDEDVKLGKVYSSKEYWSIAELHLSGWACDGPQEDGSPFLTQWYVIAPAGEVRFLGSGMWLLDAGDYDHDGKSEVLFAVGGYNRGGYRLFYRDFNRSAEFLFTYH